MKLYPAERQLFFASVLVACLNQVLLWSKGVSATLDHFSLPWACAFFFFLVGQLLRRYEATQRLALVSHVLALLFCVIPQSADLTFLLLPLHMPSIDSTLVWLDSLLGSSWPAWCAWLAGQPALNDIVRPIYVATLPTVLCAMLLLAMRFDVLRLQTLMLASSIGLVLTIACWALLPSAGASGYWHLDPAIASVVSPVVDSTHGFKIVELMRDGITDLTIMPSGGMIGFPSYHTTVGLFIGAAVWPYLVLRIAFLLIAPLLAIGILTHGGHNLMDVVGGAAVAFASWRMASQLITYYGHRAALATSGDMKSAVSVP